MAARIQRTRKPGWRAPEGARYVGRPSAFGNPWRVVRLGPRLWTAHWDPYGAMTSPWTPAPQPAVESLAVAHRLAVSAYGAWIQTQPDLIRRIRNELAGLDLMCWCAEELACHLDVLLPLAAPGPEEATR